MNWISPAGKAIHATATFIGKNSSTAASWASKILKRNKVSSWLIKTPLVWIWRRR